MGLVDLVKEAETCESVARLREIVARLREIVISFASEYNCEVEFPRGQRDYGDNDHRDGDQHYVIHDMGQ